MATPMEKEKRFQKEIEQVVDDLKKKGEWPVSAPTPTTPVSQFEETEVSILPPESEEAKVIVEDLSDRLGLPGAFILVFKDRKTGRRHPYLTKEALAFKVEQKGKRAVQFKVVQEDTVKGTYEYECSITPELTTKDYELLNNLLAAVQKAPSPEMYEAALMLFNQTFNALQTPTVDRGEATLDSVRMRTMKTPTNMKRIGKKRAFCHAANLYTGCGLAALPPEVEEAGEVIETSGALPEKHE